jgi:hypothetical protein
MMGKKENHTTIGLKKATKERLDEKRAPGQCYDGFLCQLMDMWEEVKTGHTSPGKKNIKNNKEVPI